MNTSAVERCRPISLKFAISALGPGFLNILPYLIVPKTLDSISYDHLIDLEVHSVIEKDRTGIVPIRHRRREQEYYASKRAAQ